MCQAHHLMAYFTGTISASISGSKSHLFSVPGQVGGATTQFSFARFHFWEHRASCNESVDVFPRGENIVPICDILTRPHLYIYLHPKSWDEHMALRQRPPIYMYHHVTWFQSAVSFERAWLNFLRLNRGLKLAHPEFFRNAVNIGIWLLL